MTSDRRTHVNASERLRSVPRVLFIALALSCVAKATPQSQELQSPSEPRQKPAATTGTTRVENADGPLNLYNAVGVAADPSAEGRGVLVVMNDWIILLSLALLSKRTPEEIQKLFYE